MLHNLVVDLFKDRQKRLTWVMVFLAVINLLAGVLSGFLDHWHPVRLAATYLVKDINADFSNLPAPSLIHYIAFLLPVSLVIFTHTEITYIFESRSAKINQSLWMSYPISRWMLFMSRMVYLAIIFIVLILISVIGFIIGRVTVFPFDPGWEILPFLPVLFLLVTLFVMLAAIIINHTSRLWLGNIIVFCILLLAYYFYIAPGLAVSGFQLKHLSLLSAYLGKDANFSSPSLSGFIILSVLDAFTGTIFWKVFEKSDMSYRGS